MLHSFLKNVDLHDRPAESRGTTSAIHIAIRLSARTTVSINRQLSRPPKLRISQIMASQYKNEANQSSLHFDRKTQTDAFDVQVLSFYVA